jgi:hypothetical protein
LDAKPAKSWYVSENGHYTAMALILRQFTPQAPHISMGLDGCEIYTNSSGSHHELRKLHTRVELIVSATLKSGGIYLYANQQGCTFGNLFHSIPPNAD